MAIAETELILNARNRVYHLDIDPQEIADDVIVVGDPDRVGQVSALFNSVGSRTQHREFISHSGTFKQKKITVLSTGIGPDNIDIVMNELDAAVNFDPMSRTEKKDKRRLNIYRLGTCGALQEDLRVNSLVVGSFALGLDNLMHFYTGWEQLAENDLVERFCDQQQWPLPSRPYCFAADATLLEKFPASFHKGITVTAPGFYAPQGRFLRLKPAVDDLVGRLSSFSHKGQPVLNFEMESSALYGLGRLLGHRCVSICVVIANRARREFSTDLGNSVDHLIRQTLDQITS